MSRSSAPSPSPPLATISPPNSFTKKPVPLTKFTLFPNLPVELRTKIWKESVIANQRIVEVYFDNDQNHFLSTTLAPPQLHTSSEARSVSLGLYKPLSLGGHFTGTHIRWESEAILFDMDQARTLAVQLVKKDAVGLLCEELYQHCTRVVLGRGQGMTNYMDFGAMVRAEPTFVLADEDSDSDAGEWEEDKLFGLFEQLEEVSLVYLNKVKKGEGNLSIVMASSDPKDAAARPGTTRYKITKLAQTFPKAGHFAQSVDTIKDINIVKLDRGGEKRLKGAARVKAWMRRDEERREAWLEAKEAVDAVFSAEFEDTTDQVWAARMFDWASKIPGVGEVVLEEDVLEDY